MTTLIRKATVDKIAGVIERDKETITPNDRYLFHNYPSRVFSCTSPFPMRRGPAPRLIIVFANVISTVIRWRRRVAHHRSWMMWRITRRWCYRPCGANWTRGTPWHIWMVMWIWRDRMRWRMHMSRRRVTVFWRRLHCLCRGRGV